MKKKSLWDNQWKVNTNWTVDDFKELLFTFLGVVTDYGYIF